MRSYFFNAEPSEDLTLHPSGYDREYDADDHAAFFRPFFGEKGVIAALGPDACLVTVDQGTTLKAAPGHAYIRGRMAEFDGTERVEVTGACSIVARMNKGADVREFQLLAVTELVDTQDVCDLELAQVTLTPVSGGYTAQVTDTRTYLTYMGQPAYYPPDSDSLPYVLWLYTLGFPMDEEQQAMVEANPSLMAIYEASVGATRPAAVSFTAEDWSGGVLVIPKASHKRRSGAFTYSLRHLVDGELRTNTWCVLCTGVTYQSAAGTITLSSADPYAGEIVFSG